MPHTEEPVSVEEQVERVTIGGFTTEWHPCFSKRDAILQQLRIRQQALGVDMLNLAEAARAIDAGPAPVAQGGLPGASNALVYHRGRQRS